MFPSMVDNVLERLSEIGLLAGKSLSAIAFSTLHFITSFFSFPQELFKMTKEEFNKLPRWKQIQLKKEKGFF